MVSAPSSQRLAIGAAWVEEPLSQFANGKNPRIVNYPGTLPPQIVLARARSYLYSEYRLFSWNCEHFVRYAHGLKMTSPQISRAVALCAIAGVLIPTLLRAR